MQRKVLVLALVFVFLAVSCLIVVTFVSVASEDTTLDFLTAVAGVDISKYKIEKTDALETGFAEQTVKYRFESYGSKMEVISNFKDGAIVWCKIYRLEGLPIFTVSTADALDSAKNLLSRYQSYSKASYLQPIQDSLNTLTASKPMMTENANIKLEVQDEGNYSRFFWTARATQSTASKSPQKGISLSFYNGTFETFGDYWNCFTVGNADVKFDREAAIQLQKNVHKTTRTILGIQ